MKEHYMNAVRLYIVLKYLPMAGIVIEQLQPSISISLWNKSTPLYLRHKNLIIIKVLKLGKIIERLWGNESSRITSLMSCEFNIKWLITLKYALSAKCTLMVKCTSYGVSGGVTFTYLR